MVGCQTDRTRAAHRPIRRGKTLVFVGGGDGRGTSLLAFNIGVCAARRGVVTLVRGIEHAPFRAEAIPPALRLIGGDSRLPHATPDSYESALLSVSNQLPDDSRALALQADRLVLVATPNPAALADAYAALKLLVAGGSRAGVGIIVDGANSPEQARRVADRMKHTMSQFLGLSPVELGHVPIDRRVEKSCGSQPPIVLSRPRSAASRCIEEVSSQVAEWSGVASGNAGLWSRLAGVFL